MSTRPQSSKALKGAAERARATLERLSARYPDPESALDWGAPWQLLTATVLAAQCTDERVNKVTPELFRRWPGPAELALAGQDELEEVIHSTGFFRQKAKNLIAAAKLVMDEFGGEPPRSLAELTRLPGVARKTANIVLSNAYGIHEGVAVDTHVKRISYRLGLTDSDDPKIIERDLMPLVPREHWGDFNHYLVFFGREVCRARGPLCGECPLADFCPRRGVREPAKAGARDVANPSGKPEGEAAGEASGKASGKTPGKALAKAAGKASPEATGKASGKKPA